MSTFDFGFDERWTFEVGCLFSSEGLQEWNLG